VNCGPLQMKRTSVTVAAILNLVLPLQFVVQNPQREEAATGQSRLLKMGGELIACCVH